MELVLEKQTNKHTNEQKKNKNINSIDKWTQYTIGGEAVLCSSSSRWAKQEAWRYKGRHRHSIGIPDRFQNKTTCAVCTGSVLYTKNDLYKKTEMSSLCPYVTNGHLKVWHWRFLSKRCVNYVSSNQFGNLL